MAMRIAQLIDTLSVGGAQRLLLLFAREVRGLDVELTVATLFPSRSGRIAADLESMGVRVEPFHGKGLMDPRRAARLLRFLRRGGFDVLFTHLTQSNTLGPLVGRMAGIPTLATLHSALEIERRSRSKYLESWSLRHAVHCTVAVGHAVAASHHKALAGARCVVIPNPVSRTASQTSAERLAIRRELIGAGGPMLASVGRLRPVKGYGDLLAVFAKLRRTHPEAALVIIGTGPDEEKLRAQIDTLGLGGHAHLIGLRDDVTCILAAADVYVCSSRHEGLPLSVLEAMEAGLPVVATDVGDVGSVVVEGTGLVVPPRDALAMERALRLVLDDPQLLQTMGAAARRHVHRNYPVDRWVQRLLRLGREVGGNVERPSTTGAA